MFFLPNSKYDLSHVTLSALQTTPQSEYNMRLAKIARVLAEKKADGMVFFSSDAIFYLTGSNLYQTERPIVFIFNPAGENVLFVPRLELEHASHKTKSCRVVCYPEYPGERHPMQYLKDTLVEMGLAKSHLAADMPGYPGVCGYHGPDLKQLFPELTLTLLPRLITEMKVYKSPFEVSMVRESARWGTLAHHLLQENTKPGLNEVDISYKTRGQTMNIMLKTLSSVYQLTGNENVEAEYRGQIGKNSYFPHATVAGMTIRQGDILVTGTGATVLGYNSELERVFFVGEPSAEQAKFYNYAVMAQDAAFSAIKPGKKCSDVDKAMMQFFKENNLQQYWRHHTGHCLATGPHESPLFDIGDDTLLEPGMVFSVEPGLYVEGLGGFRLSDTITVTETGCEVITYAPRAIDEIICE